MPLKKLLRHYYEHNISCNGSLPVFVRQRYPRYYFSTANWLSTACSHRTISCLYVNIHLNNDRLLVACHYGFYTERPKNASRAIFFLLICMACIALLFYSAYQYGIAFPIKYTLLSISVVCKRHINFFYMIRSEWLITCTCTRS